MKKSTLPSLYKTAAPSNRDLHHSSPIMTAQAILNHEIFLAKASIQSSNDDFRLI